MPYEIILSAEAVDDLRRLKANVRATVKAAISLHLRHQPTQVSNSRIKRLEGMQTPGYRLRVDEVRVFYDVADDQVEILAVVAKMGAATWLAQFGEAEEEGDDEADTAFSCKE